MAAERPIATNPPQPIQRPDASDISHDGNAASAVVAVGASRVWREAFPSSGMLQPFPRRGSRAASSEAAPRRRNRVRPPTRPAGGPVAGKCPFAQQCASSPANAVRHVMSRLRRRNARSRPAPFHDRGERSKADNADFWPKWFRALPNRPHAVFRRRLIKDHGMHLSFSGVQLPPGYEGRGQAVPETRERRWLLFVKRRQRRLLAAARVVGIDPPSGISARCTWSFRWPVRPSRCRGRPPVFDQILNAQQSLFKRRDS